jgi:adenylate kinase
VKTNPSKKDGVCDKCGGEVKQRADDKPESVAVRLDVYERNTRPVLDFYQKRHLYKKVRGTGSTEQIFQELKKVIETF